MIKTGTPNREGNFHDRANALESFSSRAANTANMVATGSGHDKRLAGQLDHYARQVYIYTLVSSTVCIFQNIGYEDLALHSP